MANTADAVGAGNIAAEFFGGAADPQCWAGITGPMPVLST
jgi:hypothetical protein